MVPHHNRDTTWLPDNEALLSDQVQLSHERRARFTGCARLDRTADFQELFRSSVKTPRNDEKADD
jgi:hypothetical protein